MFTGIVEEIGTVSKVVHGSTSFTIMIAAKTVLQDVHLGDSIAVNGVCLTVSKFDANSFAADIMPETYMATALKKLRTGSVVNLERAMRADGRFGGHFVSGHVDGTGTIIEKKRSENALYVTIQVPDTCHSFIHDKGSIAIDGTSLTVFGVKGNNITISLIPHTQTATILAEKAVGDPVNIECDMLAKYVFHMLNKTGQSNRGVTMETLVNNGFL
ncbi:riboflavin synthase [Siminovitchia sp. FSL H7-0308]|uniref:riboflavin synthase n=1 Tax=Siminovitchia TaxID=2837510 RepID=UPI00196275A5|nr:riboflavin synthase [Siminovitchia thermophila]